MSIEEDSIKIAIADDHELFRAGIVKILQGYSQFEVILEASNGKVLLDKIETSLHLPDIVLLDIRMPEMDGFDTATVLINNFPSIKVVVLSMHDSARHIIRMIELGAHGYLFKNAHPDDVIESINLVLENDYYFNDKINSLLQKVIRYKGRNSGDLDIPVAISPRESQVLELICKEHTNNEIAELLFLSARTVEGHRKNLVSKLGVRNIAGLVVYAFKHELVQMA
ncbi:response regulator transcription factor [uncultured Dokdonia sp.]|uniref:response regulator transcription factor n=1 Tax=uncultured Dokdonia sp. TaxID=575653 RepID=UPI0026040421|nr:response regulator transcription factor [uncultured Dokdonia sp.]